MSDLNSNFSEIEPHDHLCLLYENHKEWKTAVIKFLQTGLRQNDKCLYISGAHTGKNIKKYLKEVEIDVEAKIESGQLILLAKETSYARSQEFIPQEMVDFLKNESKQAVKQGYDSLRVTGEISWALDYERGEEKIIEYEIKLNQSLFHKYPVTALCRYHLDKFKPAMIKNVIKTHPYIVLDNQIHANPYYIEPEHFNLEQEEVKQWLKNISDYTNLKGRFQTVIKRNKEQLKQKNEELEQLLYITSHDLRSPLINIHGFSQEIKDSFREVKELINSSDNNGQEKLDYYLTEELPEAIDYITHSAEKIDKLLQGLLKLSRININSINKEIVDVNNLVAQIRDNFEYQLQNSGIQLKVDDLPPCYAARDHLNRVFSNLLENAIKYLKSDTKGEISITAWRLKTRVVYAVRDNGMGIAVKDHDKVFKLFRRVNANSNISGEGIGLALIKKIIALHQGKVWLEAKEGQGSTFFFSIANY
ncbi:MAG: MEDS domain-containing protein [Bacillota bacterium]